GYISQFYAMSFQDLLYPSITFRTAKHYIHYRKAKHFKDEESAAYIASLPTT
ncbi:hypothetical protein BKA67DRAFT_527899, partial [Truncatella angustata]